MSSLKASRLREKPPFPSPLTHSDISGGTDERASLSGGEVLLLVAWFGHINNNVRLKIA